MDQALDNMVPRPIKNEPVLMEKMTRPVNSLRKPPHNKKFRLLSLSGTHRVSDEKKSSMSQADSPFLEYAFDRMNQKYNKHTKV